MRIDEIVPGTAYEEGWVGRHVTALGIEYDKRGTSNRRMVRVRDEKTGAEELVSPARIRRTWAEGEAERALIERADALAKRLVGALRIQAWAAGTPGMIAFGVMSADDAEALLRRLGVEVPE